MMNPIYEREQKKEARSIRFSVLFLVLNAGLAAAALLSMALALHQAGETGEMQYAAFLEIFRMLAWMEFAMAALLAPAGTVGCISGERERKTLDLLRSSRMSPMEIAAGNLLSALSSVLVLLLGGAPVMASVFLFGGIRALQLLLLLGACLLTGLLTGAIGLLFSSRSETTGVAAAKAYTATAVLMFGPYGLNLLMRRLTFLVEGSRRLLLLSPLTTFSAALCQATGLEDGFLALAEHGVADPAQLIVRAVFCQLLMTAAVFFMAGRSVFMERHSRGAGFWRRLYRNRNIERGNTGADRR